MLKLAEVLSSAVTATAYERKLSYLTSLSCVTYVICLFVFSGFSLFGSEGGNYYNSLFSSLFSLSIHFLISYIFQVC